MNDIRVTIIDDHAILRQSLRAMLDREPGIQVTGEASGARTALAVIAQTRPDVVLLDLKLSAASDCEGLGLCAELCKRFPGSKVLVLTSFPDEWLVLDAVRQGAKGYLVKDVDLTELVRAIRAVHQGGSAFDSHSAGMVVDWLRNTQAREGSAQQITPREQEILGLLARGLSNIAIGQRLYISPATVKFHVSHLLRKLGVSRRAEAVYAATKIGLI